MQDLKDVGDLIVFIVMGGLGGVVSELRARRKIWFPWLLAILIGFVGALVGSWVINDLLGLFNDPAVDHVSIFPALIGAILFLLPWWGLRSGKIETRYNRNRKWRNRYWRK